MTNLFTIHNSLFTIHNSLFKIPCWIFNIRLMILHSLLTIRYSITPTIPLCPLRMKSEVGGWSPPVGWERDQCEPRYNLQRLRLAARYALTK